MKLSENWLRQWANPQLDSDTLAEQLTMAGLELDDKFSVAKPFSGVVVAEVQEVEQHPDADKLKVVKVFAGSDVNDGKPLQIVCGASNVRVGIKVPLATVGAVLPPIADKDGIEKPFKIKKGKLRGVESFGMLCGASEIDLEDEIDGLLELDSDAPVGVNIREYLGLDNQVLDISITPNRGDCFSVRGIARETAVLNNMSVTAPEITENPVTIDATQNVVIEETAACPRYLAQVVHGIDRSVATPRWMSDALNHSGIRTHNFLVDVTNYVLMELGQPMHAFDADKISGDICVRFAKKDETLELLNDDSITLTGDELVIADDSGAIALAGIMGGASTSVTDSTTNIVLESAHFDQITIAGRARRFGLHTDASQRFERGVDFELPTQAMKRAVNLILAITNAQAGAVTCVEDISQLPSRQDISITAEKVNTVLGTDISLDEIEAILTSLGLVVRRHEQQLVCTPPSWRFDMSIPEDLVEEVARVYGYDNITNKLPHLEASMHYDDSADLLHALKLKMTDVGYTEAVSFSFCDEKIEQIVHDEALGEILALANPISSDLAVMRRTMLSSLLPCVQYNLNRQQSRVRFFETGLTFVGANVSELVQTPSIALVAVGDVAQEQVDASQPMDFYDLKHDFEQLLPAQFDKTNVEYRKSKLKFLHPGQSADIFINGEHIGWLGQLHPNVSKALDLPTTWVAQASSSVLIDLARDKYTIATPSKFPLVKRDIAIIVDNTIELDTIFKSVRSSAGSLLTDLWLFDVYEGEHIPEGKRSLAFTMVYQDPNATLADEIVNSTTEKVTSKLVTDFDATLRDS